MTRTNVLRAAHACYSTGSFTTVRSWDQAGPTSALSRSRSQEKGRTEASDRRSRRRGRRYPRATGLTPRSAKAGILTSRHLSFRPKKKVGLKAERSPDATQPLGAPRSAMRASLRGVKNELTRVHTTPPFGRAPERQAGLVLAKTFMVPPPLTNRAEPNGGSVSAN